MSLYDWLHDLRFTLTPLQDQRHSRRRVSRQSRTFRPHLEVLEDRRVLSFVPGSFSLGQPEAPISAPFEWSPATYMVRADFSGDGRLDFVEIDHHYWDDQTVVHVFLGESTGGTVLWETVYINGLVHSVVGVGDAFGDGRMDLVFGGNASWVEGYGYLILYNDGDWGGLGPPPPNLPQLSISDATVTEGNAGLVSATFHVSLSSPSSETITLDFATGDGSAGYGSGDYVAASGTLVFAPGETSKSITVQVIGDTTFEPNETFVVYSTGATGAIFGDGQGVGTIVNDDVPLPSLNIDDVVKNEGHSGTTAFTFTVRLSAPSSVPVTVQYATANGTARASGSDYYAKSGTLTFKPGQISKTITILARGDRTREADETFFLNLANSQGAWIGDGQGLGTIRNDDVGTWAALLNDLALSRIQQRAPLRLWQLSR